MKSNSADKGLASVAVVVLAAGGASRYGEPKQLLDWEGRSLLAHVIDLVSGIGLPVYVCLGAYKEKISKSLAFSSVQVIDVPSWEQGQGASIKTAIEYLTCLDNYTAHNKLRGVIFVLADQPLIAPEFFKQMIETIACSNYEIPVCTQYPLVGGVGIVGVPVYFPKKEFGSLLGLDDAKGAKFILKALDYIALPVKGSVLDIDTKDDLVQARELALKSN